ncbi:tyrosine-type recombinase/integrase [Methylobacterium oxalidis]|uniref:tyrosine-type recombinase/integrase n=1 Tax=Methylobacterium oxalidis TaxID=944322 RepID=UPI003315A744
MATVYRRGAVWWVRFRLGGVHVRRSAKTTKKAEAQVFLRRLLDEAATKARGDAPRHSFNEAVERYFVEASLKPKTRHCYGSSSRALKPSFEPLFLDQIGRRAIADFVSSRKKDGVSDTSIRRDLAFLSSLCAMAIRWGWLEANPVTAYNKKALKEARPRTRFLQPAEFERLLATSSPEMRPALILAVETGMRKEELFGLTVGDIDLLRREIHLERTKTSSPRRVPMSERAMQTVQDLLHAPNRPGSPYLLCRADGTRYGDMKKGFANACRRAKIANFRWHDLRHTFASWFVQQDGDLYRLSRILGHATLQMTARYGHLRTSDLHAEIEKVARKRTQDRLIMSPQKPTPDH